MSIFNSSTNTNTLIGIENQLSAQMSIPLNVEGRRNTTINFKRNNNALAPIGAGEYPKLQYFGIGIRGFFNVNDGNTDVALSSPYRPSAENMDLYRPIPFRCIPVSEITTQAELTALTNPTDPTKPKYRMLTKETFGGVDYYCFWLKKLTFPVNAVELSRIDLLSSGRSEYVFDNSNLQPVPVRTSGVDTEVSATSKVVATVTGIVPVTGAEIAEAINVMFAGDFRLARISEFGFYTGIDRANVTQGFLSGLTYNEALHAQLANHRCTLGSDLSAVDSRITETLRYENGSQFLN